jgi:hypothetical protein
MAGRARVVVGVVAAVCGLVSAGLVALDPAAEADPDTAGQGAGITGSGAGLVGVASAASERSVVAGGHIGDAVTGDGDHA